VKGCPPTFALAGIKKESEKLAGGGGIQKFGEGGGVAGLGGGMEGGDESVLGRVESEGKRNEVLPIKHCNDVRKDPCPS